MLCLSIIAYVFSSTKLEKKAEQVLPGSEEVGGRWRGPGAVGRDDPNNVCTYEYMHKEKKETRKLECCYYLHLVYSSILSRTSVSYSLLVASLVLSSL
jgi:hypothetical protein